MRLLNAIIKKKPTPEKGYTLFELLIVVVLIGILSAIAAPSFFGWVTRAKVNDAQTVVKGAFAEAQREAMRKSKSCTVTLPTTGTLNPTIESNCFVLGDRTLNGVKIRHNWTTVKTAGTGTTLFDFKGRTEDYLDNHLVIVISPRDNESYQKCLIISDDLGLIRTGKYPSNDTTTDFNKCTN